MIAPGERQCPRYSRRSTKAASEAPRGTWPPRAPEGPRRDPPARRILAGLPDRGVAARLRRALRRRDRRGRGDRPGPRPLFPEGARSSRKSPALSGRGGLFPEESSSSRKSSALPDPAQLFLEEIDPSTKRQALPGKVGLFSIPGAGEMSLAKRRLPSRGGNDPSEGKDSPARARRPRARENGNVARTISRRPGRFPRARESENRRRRAPAQTGSRARSRIHPAPLIARAYMPVRGPTSRAGRSGC
jgi:hypothetical protein